MAAESDDQQPQPVTARGQDRLESAAVGHRGGHAPAPTGTPIVAALQDSPLREIERFSVRARARDVEL